MMWCGHRNDECPSGSCVIWPPVSFWCQSFMGRRDGRNQEKLASPFHCPRTESTHLKICFAAACSTVRALLSACLTSSSCPAPTFGQPSAMKVDAAQVGNCSASALHGWFRQRYSASAVSLPWQLKASPSHSLGGTVFILVLPPFT